MNIVLDSNIFISDFIMKSPNWDALIDFVKRTDSQIIIPQVIIDEVDAAYKRTKEEYIDSYKKLIAKFSRIGLDITSHPLRSNFDKYSDFIKKQLKIDIYPYQNDSLPELCTRVIERKKPAKKDGKDFRDTIIWLSLKSLCATNSHKQIVFISENISDFGGENKLLHPNLQKECDEEKIHVEYYTSINSFLSKFSPTAKKIQNTYTKKWIENNLDYDEIETQLKDILSDENWDIANECLFESKAHYFKVKYIEDFNIENFYSYLLADGIVIINLDLVGNISLQEIFEYRGDQVLGNILSDVSIEFSVIVRIKDDEIIETFVKDDYYI